MEKCRIGFIVGIGMGVAIGYATLAAPFYWFTFLERRSHTLGGLVSDTLAGQMAGLYESDVDLDDVTWNPPNLPVPFLGSAPWPGTHANATINEQGFRHEGTVGAKASETYRIFLTGGSTAFGTGASSQGMTIGKILESDLNASAPPRMRYEVIAAANPSWATTHERILIENTLTELEPDLVVSLSGNNDVHWAVRGYDVFGFRTYQEHYYFRNLRMLHLMTMLVDLKLRSMEGARVAPTTVEHRLAKNVALSSYALGMVEADYLFVLQPTIAVTAKSLSRREQEHVEERVPTDELDFFRACYTGMRTRLSEIAASNFAFIDATAIFDGMTTTDEIFIDSYHFGDVGNRMIAEVISDGVRARSEPMAGSG